MYNNLRAECARANITNRQIAHKLNISENTVTNIMNGKTKVSVETAFKIRHLFFPNLDLEYLFAN